MDNTFFKVYRSLLDDPLWLSEPFTYGQAWVDLIGRANFADKDNFYRGRYQQIKRGQIATSQQELAARWKWSRRKVHTFLKNLEAAGMCTAKVTPFGTTLTIEKYAFYQDGRTGKSTTKNPREHIGSTTEAQREHIGSTQNKKDKKERREEGIYIPSRGDLASFIESEGLNADPDDVFDYYEAIGWEIGGKPIKDWRAVVRRWKQYEAPKAEQAKRGLDMDKVNEYLDKLERGEPI